MSYTEYHKGKFKIVARSKEEIKSFVKHNKLEDSFDLDDKFGGYYSKDDKYVIVCHPKDRRERVLIEFLSHKKYDIDEDDIDSIEQNSDGTYSFETKFYNGGWSLDESLESFLDKVGIDNDPGSTFVADEKWTHDCAKAILKELNVDYDIFKMYKIVGLIKKYQDNV